MERREGMTDEENGMSEGEDEKERKKRQGRDGTLLYEVLLRRRKENKIKVRGGKAREIQ